MKASERGLPLCGQEKGCASCDALRDFVSGPAPRLQLGCLSKVKQQHVRQVVAWLAAPEGGEHGLTVTEAPGVLKRLLGNGVFVLTTWQCLGVRDVGLHVSQSDTVR